MSEEKPTARKLQLKEHKGAYVWDYAEMDDLPGFLCRENDVWVCSYPRSGTTLIQQTVYLIMTLDFEKAVTVDLDDRFPTSDIHDDSLPYRRGLKYLDSMPMSEPRMIKSHMHHYLLPDQLKQGKGKTRFHLDAELASAMFQKCLAKRQETAVYIIVYITRNPKASVVSWYKLMNYAGQPPAPTLKEYVKKFLTQKDVYCCPWGLHVREYWERRHEPRILFLQFEKVVKDRRGTIENIAEFLGKDLTKDQVDKIVDFTSIESMKSNKTCNLLYFEEMFKTDTSEGAFINKGEVSGWRNDLSDDLIQKMDDLIKRELKDTDLVYE